MTNNHTTVIYIRDVSPETKHRIRQQAQARGYTYSQYIERLVNLHDELRDMAARPDLPVGDILGRHGLGPIDL